MGPAFQRTILADFRSLHQLQRDLVVFLETQGVPPKASHDVQVVCEELIVNAIRHGVGSRTGADHRIELSVALADAITIRICDDLPLFDPTSVPLPVRPISLADATVGGRGLTLVRRATTLFRWQAANGRNLIVAEVPCGQR